jgi:hypothetical protein
MLQKAFVAGRRLNDSSTRSNQPINRPQEKSWYKKPQEEISKFIFLPVD